MLLFYSFILSPLCLLLFFTICLMLQDFSLTLLFISYSARHTLLLSMHLSIDSRSTVTVLIFHPMYLSVFCTSFPLHYSLSVVSFLCLSFSFCRFVFFSCLPFIVVFCCTSRSLLAFLVAAVSSRSITPHLRVFAQVCCPASFVLVIQIDPLFALFAVYSILSLPYLFAWSLVNASIPRFVFDSRLWPPSHCANKFVSYYGAHLLPSLRPVLYVPFSLLRSIYYDCVVSFFRRVCPIEFASKIPSVH